MNIYKNNIIKIVNWTLVILYDIVSVFWCYIFIDNIIFNFTNTKIVHFGLDYTAYPIGGIDTTSWEFIIENLLGSILPAIFIILSVTTALLLTMSALNRQTTKKLNILLIIFATFSLLIFFAMPEQSYSVSLYKLMRKGRHIQDFLLFYIPISISVISINFSSYIKSKREDIK